MDPRTVTANQLRKLTESMAGARGRDVFLVLRGQELMVVDTKEDADELILTCNTAEDVHRTSQVDGINLTIKTDPPLGTVGPSQQSTVKVTEPYDALFFSESVVDKFVINYYSRFMAPKDMQVFLDKYNQEEVYAMAHLPKSIAEALRKNELPVDLLTPRRTGGPPSEAKILEFISFKEFLAR